MLRLTKSTHYQIRILLYVARALPGPMPVRDIANDLELPLPNALRLVNRLIHAGLLIAKRGPGGGVRLSRPASTINIGSTIAELEQANAKSEGADWSITRHENTAASALEAAFAMFVEVLDQHTLADLVSGVLVPAARKPDDKRMDESGGRPWVCT